MGENLRQILEEQKRYYQARAAEYDQWFYRQGRYDYGAEYTKQWETEAALVRQRLINIHLTGHILIDAVVKQTDNFFLYGWGTNLQN